MRLVSQPLLRIRIGEQIHTEIGSDSRGRARGKWPAKHACRHQQSDGRPRVPVGTEVLTIAPHPLEAVERDAVRVVEVEQMQTRTAARLIAAQDL